MTNEKERSPLSHKSLLISSLVDFIPHSHLGFSQTQTTQPRESVDCTQLFTIKKLKAHHIIQILYISSVSSEWQFYFQVPYLRLVHTCSGRLKKLFSIFSQLKWKWFSQVCLNNHGDKTQLALFLICSLDIALLHSGCLNFKPMRPT